LISDRTYYHRDARLEGLDFKPPPEHTNTLNERIVRFDTK
jgi:hypothetical protein